MREKKIERERERERERESESRCALCLLYEVCEVCGCLNVQAQERRSGPAVFLADSFMIYRSDKDAFCRSLHNPTFESILSLDVRQFRGCLHS